MNLPEIGLLVISVLASAFGQLFLKLGAMKLGKVHGGNVISHILNIILTPELLAGLAFYGVGAIAYILILTRVNISVAAPAASLIYIFAVLMGYFFFNETITLPRAVGLGFIACGVVLVVWEKNPG